jgi:hypothetical protein
MSAAEPGPGAPKPAPAPTPAPDKLLGNIVFGGGAVAAAAFFLWAAVGVYASQIIPLFVLGALGVGGMWLGARMKKDPEPNKAVTWTRTPRE